MVKHIALIFWENIFILDKKPQKLKEEHLNFLFLSFQGLNQLFIFQGYNLPICPFLEVRVFRNLKVRIVKGLFFLEHLKTNVKYKHFHYRMLRNSKYVRILIDNFFQDLYAHDFIHGDQQVIWNCNDDFILLNRFRCAYSDDSFTFLAKICRISDSRIY